MVERGKVVKADLSKGAHLETWGQEENKWSNSSKERVGAGRKKDEGRSSEGRLYN